MKILLGLLHWFLNEIEVMYINNMLDIMYDVERSERELITRIR